MYAHHHWYNYLKSPSTDATQLVSLHRYWKQYSDPLQRTITTAQLDTLNAVVLNKPVALTTTHQNQNKVTYVQSQDR